MQADTHCRCIRRRNQLRGGLDAPKRSRELDHETVACGTEDAPTERADDRLNRRTHTANRVDSR